MVAQDWKEQLFQHQQCVGECHSGGGVMTLSFIKQQKNGEEAVPDSKQSDQDQHSYQRSEKTAMWHWQWGLCDGDVTGSTWFQRVRKVARELPGIFGIVYCLAHIQDLLHFCATILTCFHI
jgi:hypothetical protein